MQNHRAGKELMSLNFDLYLLDYILLFMQLFLKYMYCKCPKISNTKVSDKTTYANMQTQIRLLLKEQSDQGLHCLTFH